MKSVYNFKMKQLCLLITILNVQVTAQQTIEPVELLTIPHILKTPIIRDFSVAPDSKKLALNISGLGKDAIGILSGNKFTKTPFTSLRSMDERDLIWSPDNKRTAFIASRGHRWQTYIADDNGENARRITRHAGNDREPRFSPDGRFIAYLSQRQTQTDWNLWLATVPEGISRQLSNHPFDEEDHRWSPNGKHIALTYNAGRHVNRRIALITLSASQEHLVELLPEHWQGDSFGAQWSPDSKKIVFVSDENGQNAIYQIGLSNKAPTLLINSPYELSNPSWSPDGNYLSYLENNNGNIRLKLYDTKSQTQRSLALRAGVHSKPIWNNDSKSVLSLYESWNYPREVWSYSIEGGRERISDTLPRDVDVRELVRPQLIRFQSFDNLEITGFLYLPEDASADNPVPLLVRPHGGPTAQWTNSWHPFTQLLVQHGYAVFAPNVRGSTGYGVAFSNLNNGDWGQGDLEDLIAGTHTISKLPEIQNNRIGIWGVSYGGFLTLAAIARHPELFACAIEAVGMPDLEKLYRDTNVDGRSYLDRELGPLSGNLELYRKLSPVHNVKQIVTPLLSFHGEDYPLVPYSTKKRFFDALRQKKNFPLIELIFKNGKVRGTYQHDRYPGASWAYIEKVLEFLSIYL